MARKRRARWRLPLSPRCYYCGGLAGTAPHIVRRNGIGLIFCTREHAELCAREEFT